MPISPKKLLIGAILCLGCCLTSVRTVAQTPFFSQFDALPMQFNPAFAGNDISPEITAIFRDQWPGFDHTYVTFGVAYEQYFEPLNSGIGITVLSDRQASGLLNSYSAALTYAYGVQLSDDAQLRIGVEASYTQRRIAWEELRFFDQIDLLTGFNDASGIPNPTGEIAPGDNQSQYFDAGLGLLIFNRKLYAGLSMGHLAQPDVAFFSDSEDILPYRFGLQAGAKLKVGETMKRSYYFEPLLLLFSEGRSNMAYAEVGFELGAIKPVVGYRHTLSNPSAFVGGFRVRSGLFRMGYTYDYFLGNLAGNSGGAHELSISVFLQTDRQRREDRALREAIGCPLF